MQKDKKTNETLFQRLNTALQVSVAVGISPRGVGSGVEMEKKEITRKAVHDFLEELIDGKPMAEQLAMLKEIMVDDICYFGFLDQDNSLVILERTIRDIIKNPSMKIQAIKVAREKTGISLIDGKNYVEALTPGHQSYGNQKYLRISELPSYGKIGEASSGVISDHLMQNMAQRLNKIAEDYGKEPPF